MIMWRIFMKVMVTIAAIGVVINAFQMRGIIGENVDEQTGNVVFWGILLGGWTLIGVIGVIVEGVGYLKTIAYEMTHNKQNTYMPSNNPGYSYSQSTGGYGPSSSQGGSVAISNAKGKSILEAVQEENRMQFHPGTAGSTGGWMCPKCGEKNEEGNTYCKYCGTHK